MATLIDSYSESNYNTSFGLSSSGEKQEGQTFRTTIPIVLNSCKFYLSKSAVFTGSIFVEVWNHVGTFGTNGKPTGSRLAISDPYIIDSRIPLITDPVSFALIEFVFSGTNKIKLDADTSYCINILYSTGGQLLVGTDTTSPSHRGNSYYSISVNNFLAYTQADDIFYIYGDIVASRLSKIVAWENKVTPFTIKTCQVCHRPIKENVYGYRFCSETKCGMPKLTDPKVLLNKIPKDAYTVKPAPTVAEIKARNPKYHTHKVANTEWKCVNEDCRN